MHMFAVSGHPDRPHFTLPPPHNSPAPPVKKKFPLQLPVRNDRREAKGNADGAASELHKIDNFCEYSEKKSFLLVVLIIGLSGNKTLLSVSLFLIKVIVRLFWDLT